MLDAVLNTLGFAIFVVDGERRPLYSNAAASALLEEGTPLHLDQAGILRVATASGDRALREGMASLQARPGRAGRHVVPVHGTGSSPAMFAWLSTLPDTAAREVSVMITRRSGQEVGREVLAHLFGLTSAESRLLQGLVQGVSPTQYAARQALSRNTVRNQLKSIFEKTEVRRQSDLMSLVCNVLAPVNFDRPQR